MISAVQRALTLAWYTSRTAASCDDDSGRGFLDGIGNLGTSSSSGEEGAIIAIILRSSVDSVSKIDYDAAKHDVKPKLLTAHELAAATRRIYEVQKSRY